MKKLSLVFVLLLGLLLIPSSVSAEDNDKVNVYFFRGEGCPHCEEAEEFFDSIKDEYGKYFTIVDYETWYNEDNAELMEKVAKARDEEASGVPYIIIGDQAWNGYASDYDDAIKKQIKKVYEQDTDSRYDIMKYVEANKKAPKTSSKEDKDYSNDILSLILIVVVAGGVCTGIYFARKKTA